MTKNQDPTLEVESPFSEDLNPALVDMTSHTGMSNTSSATLRVELRRMKEPVEKSAPYRTPEKSFVIGVIDEDSLPTKDKTFRMPYHILSGNTGFGSGQVVDFGKIDTMVAIENLVIEDNHYYFETKEGLWRLTVLDKGN